MIPDQQNTTPGRWMFIPDGTRAIALELAPRLDKLIDAVPTNSDGKLELRAFLWENKVGLLRVLQAHASPPEVREVTEIEIAHAIAGALYEWGGSGQGVDDMLADICKAQGEVAARAVVKLRPLAPSDQESGS